MSMNVPWLEVLKACYPNAQISENTEVVMVNPQYAADIAVIMSTTDRASLNNYLVWRMVQAYMPYLSKTFREVQDLYRKFLTGAQKPLSRWEFCEDTTERFFGHLLDAIFYREQARLPIFSQNRFSLMSHHFNNIRINERHFSTLTCFTKFVCFTGSDRG